MKYFILISGCAALLFYFVSRNRLAKLFAYSISEAELQSYDTNSLTDKNSNQQNAGLPPWTEGMLDIHHINTGRGDAAFSVFPDGTTMLFDAGALYKEVFERDAAPLKTPPEYLGLPSPGVKIARYIREVFPKTRPKCVIDFGVISHFHSDHYGMVRNDSNTSRTGAYKLAGITEIEELIPIRRLFDRNYPHYNLPVPLENCHSLGFYDERSVDNYLAFVRHGGSLGSMETEALTPGRNDQIRLMLRPRNFSGFSVRNLVNNGVVWTGQGFHTKAHFSPSDILNKKNQWNENLLSMAIKITYGAFDYYTGGDLVGDGFYGVPPWMDVATPVGEVAGPVDVMTLNHHGNRDGTNVQFERLMRPHVIIQQSWCSDHPGQEVFYRMSSEHVYPGPRDLFATYIHEETKVTFGRWLAKAYRSTSGHIVVRVQPGGATYHVMVLDDMQFPLKVNRVFGPYNSA